MTMPEITIDTTSIEEQLTKMTCAIPKLAKMVKEKDMQIVFLINKVEAQVQNMGESSQGLNHLLNVASPLNVHHMRIAQCKSGYKRQNLPQWCHYLSNNFMT